jgi:hypothetical protein
MKYREEYLVNGKYSEVINNCVAEGGRAEKDGFLSLIKGHLILFTREQLVNHLSKTTPLIIVTLAIKFQHLKLEGMHSNHSTFLLQ